MLFFVRNNLKGGIDAFADGCGFEDIADGTGSEAIFTNEYGDIFLGNDETKSDVSVGCLSDSELCLVWVVDEL